MTTVDGTRSDVPSHAAPDPGARPSAPGADTAAERRTGPILLILVLGALTYSLLQSMLSPALPVITREVGTTTDTASWLLTAYLLVASVTTPVVSRLGDIHGKKKLFVVAIGALGVGSLICGLADSIALLIVGRAIQGVGAAVFPLSFGIVRDEFPPHRRAAAIGLTSAVMGIGGGIGSVLAGPIVDHLSYHWLFWIPMVVCVGTVAAAWVVIPESPQRVAGARINWLGAALLGGALACLLLAVSKGRSWGWGSATVVGLFVGAVVLLALWVFSELRSSTPLVDMKVMRLRGVWTTNAVGVLCGYGMMATMFLMPQMFQLPKSTGFGFGTTVTMAGVYVLPMAVAMLVAGPTAGALEGRIGSKPSLLMGCAALAGGSLLLIVAHSEVWQIAVGLFVFGLGVGAAMAAMANVIVGAVPPDQTGIASGINTIARTVGMSFGSALSMVAVTSHVTAAGVPEESGFTLAFAIAAGAGVLALLVGLLVPAGRRAAARKVAG
ncbi:MFS transporter [Yinghuangia seranimata]|uniref:MFS transporter n=1 Tax=Yinghuangia seranimata TaxID=408067 RepID=UPI00248C234A|nr:MFS transporter [Yinghuangia seranimata]MDI2132726.1 MFS transporter [Yinghuangia seranimata]